MQELKQEELELVNGGIAVVPVIAVVVVVAAVGIGIYIGYKEAAAAAKK